MPGFGWRLREQDISKTGALYASCKLNNAIKLTAEEVAKLRKRNEYHIGH